MKMNKEVKYVLRRFVLVMLVLLLGALALAIGLMIGYGIADKISVVEPTQPLRLARQSKYN